MLLFSKLQQKEQQLQNIKKLFISQLNLVEQSFKEIQKAASEADE